MTVLVVLQIQLIDRGREGDNGIRYLEADEELTKVNIEALVGILREMQKLPV